MPRFKDDFLEKCDCYLLHEDTVEQVRKQMPDQELLIRLAELYKIFGDATRISILMCLSTAEMCVCDISTLLKMTQSAISHQLRVLKQANLVKNRRQGKAVFYCLADEHVKQIFEQGLVHIKEEY